MNYKIYLELVISFTFSTLAIVFGVMSLDFQAPSASAPVAPITRN